MATLICTKCGFEGPDEEFPRDKRNGKRRHRSSWCRGCYRVKNREYMADRPELKKRYEAEYYQRHHSRIRESQKDVRLRHRYGITEMDFNNMRIAQKSLCAICEKRVEKLDVDHCHTTGEVRGLLCRGCNMGLGIVDRPMWLERALEYLDQ